ncbi:hypothetical protein AAY473_032149 [Plecturocebus cupreus]
MENCDGIIGTVASNFCVRINRDKNQVVTTLNLSTDKMMVVPTSELKWREPAHLHCALSSEAKEMQRLYSFSPGNINLGELWQRLEPTSRATERKLPSQHPPAGYSYFGGKVGRSQCQEIKTILANTVKPGLY